MARIKGNMTSHVTSDTPAASGVDGKPKTLHTLLHTFRHTLTQEMASQNLRAEWRERDFP